MVRRGREARCPPPGGRRLRRRRPDPRSCSDPIAGTWRARVFRAEVSKVDEVTLTIARVGITELRGQIVVESWDAGARDDDPAACPDGSPAVSRVVQTASGWVHGTEVDLAGGPTLVTTNDDGGADQGRPHVFARQACR